MSVVDDLLDRARTVWPARHAHPDTTERLTGPDRVPPDELADLVLRTLAAPHAPVETAHHLVGNRKFHLVETMVDAGTFDPAEAERLTLGIDRARRAIRNAHRRDLERLEQYARRLGAQPWQHRNGRADEIDGLLRDEPERADGLIRSWLAEAATELRDRADLLRARVDASVPDGTARQIHACIDQFRFDLAEVLLTSDRPEAPENAGPRSVAPLVAPLPRPGVGLDEVFAWYGLGAHSPEAVGGPRMAAWLPAPSDKGAWDVITALREVASGVRSVGGGSGTGAWSLPTAPGQDMAALRDETAASAVSEESEVPEDSAASTAYQSDVTAPFVPAAEAVRRLVAALHTCLGSADQPAVAHRDPEGVRARLRWPRDRRFPPLALLESPYTEMWVAAEDQPPPDDMPRPVVWLVPDRTASGSPPAGCALITVDDLLRVAAPTGGPPETAAADRLVALLRLVGGQLGAERLLGRGNDGEPVGLDLADQALPAVALEWLFDLLGRRPDYVFLESLLHETGSHPALLRSAVTALCPADAGSAADVDLRSSGLERLWADRGWRTAARDRLLRHTALNPAEQAVFYTTLWLADGDPGGRFEGGELLAVMADMAGGDRDPRDVAEEVRELVGIDEVLPSLARVGLLTQDTVGVHGFAAPILPDLFGEHGPDDLWNLVGDALTALRAERRRATDTAFVEIAETIAEVIDHHNRNVENQVTKLLERALAAQGDERAEILEGMERLRSRHVGVSEQLRQAREPNTRIPLRDVLDSVKSRYEYVYLGQDSVRVIGGEDATVFTNEWLMFHLFWALAENSRYAITEVERPRHYLRVTARPVRGRAGDARLWCAVDVEDSGSGFGEDVLGRLRAGEHLSTRGSTGKGLSLSRTLAEYHHGDLELVGTSPEFLGAHVRVWLPLVEG